MAKKHVIKSEPQQLLRRQQRHSGLLGRAVALTLVTLDTRGHEILRRALAALRTRQNVVKRQVLCMPVVAAILAAVPITNVNTSPLHRRLAAPALYVDVMAQSDNRWNREHCRRRMKDVVPVILLNEHGPAEPQANGARDAHRAERLV